MEDSSSQEEAVSHQSAPSVGESSQPPAWAPRNLIAAWHGAPTAAERQELLAAMKKAFPRVLDTSVLREMSGGEMKLELTDDTVTFAITTARSTPLCWREKDQRQIDGLQEKVNHPNEWCHTLVPVPKRSTDGSVTGCILTVDLTKLDKCVNKCVNRSCSRDSRRRCTHRAP